MVARIKIGTSIRGILHYNENKVAEGEAKLILASGFAGDIENMTFQNKIQRFQHLTELKPSVETNALHISLNFDTSEKISNAKMQEIAIAYMERIGFGDQPFLVYRHNDAGHQHLHIATVSIQRDGEAIKTHNIGRDISEPARKSIEKDFYLVIAERKQYKQEPGIKAADIEKAKYGRTSTKRQISNVLAGVVNDYKFTSLAEFNAVLMQFNLIADRGKEESDMFQNKGLIYSLIGSNGEKIGVPIKSSAFYSKPTLRNLEIKFERNIEKRKPYKLNLIGRINKVFTKYERITKETLLAELKKDGINLVLRQNDHGRIYGTTFIDHQNKAVFNGSDLGKLYSANSIIERISSEDRLRSFLQPVIHQKTYLKAPSSKLEKNYLHKTAPTNYLKDLLDKSQGDYAPTIKRKKKKKKRGLTL
ncbi:MAG: relaxase/mobilization nuclease domain-containing protein [Candidatus Pedobacter colombiensis]|uniref:Relaxase/mobilization nuclease domain-containing protein n=1 Tax=Candidatus Pedobacter colombiensis TaxID=3121371 RepID=A0AAJ6B7B0_9SPHI|nr:relaxase/mobilization nuclease domain-containing protein [Pedobacter sp.]WEK17883.1 MAG: relaxase/mobilization nuclease domain-containing protein [Pedobacter sp.]